MQSSVTYGSDQVKEQNDSTLGLPEPFAGEKTILLSQSEFESGEMEVQKPLGESGWIAACANIVKTFAGAGTLALPYAFFQAGILNAILSLLLFALISNYTMKLLVKCRRYVQATDDQQFKSDYWKFRKLPKGVARRKPDHQRTFSDPPEENYQDEGEEEEEFKTPLKTSSSKKLNQDDFQINLDETDKVDYLYDFSKTFTYTDLGYEALGYFGSGLVYLLLITCNLGVATVYLVLFATTMNGMVPKVDSRFWMLAVMLIFIPMSWLRKFKYLAPASVIGTLVLTACLIIALIFAIIIRAHEIKAPWSFGEASWFKLKTYPLFFGSVAFLFCTHTMVLPLEQSLKNRKRFHLSLDLGYIIVIVNNLTFAVLFFMCYGSDVSDNPLTDNLRKGPLNYVINSLICIELILTYIIVLMPVSELVDNKVIHKVKKKSLIAFFFCSSISRTLLVILTLAIAEIFAQNFFAIMAFIGATSPNICGFIIPPLFYILLMRRKMGVITWMINCTIIVFGIVTTISCVTIVILQQAKVM